MEKSIERIWKEDNSKYALMTLPKIDNLGSLKSIFYMDKFKSIYKRNIIILALTGVLILMACIWGGVPAIGLYLFILFMILAFVGLLELTKLNQISLGDSNYKYLKSFDNWAEKLFIKFTAIYKVVIPMLFIGFSMAILKTNFFIPFIGETLYDKILHLSYGNTILIVITLTIVIFCIILSYQSKYLFAREYESIYGETVNTIKKVICELDELQ